MTILYNIVMYSTFPQLDPLEGFHFWHSAHYSHLSLALAWLCSHWPVACLSWMLIATPLPFSVLSLALSLSLFPSRLRHNTDLAVFVLFFCCSLPFTLYLS